MQITYCCKKMEEKLEEGSVYYSFITKQYLLDSQIDRISGTIQLVLNYCPFCGKELK